VVWARAHTTKTRAAYDPPMSPKRDDVAAGAHTATQLDVSANILFFLAGVIAGVVGYVLGRRRRS
jgi:hypothetical protein